MAINLSNEIRTNMVNNFVTVVAVNAWLHIRANAVPANTTVSDAANTLIVNIALANTWLAAAASGAVNKSANTWSANAGNSATAGHWRIVDNTNTTCHFQGNCTNTGNGGDMTLDNVVIAANQTVTITAFLLTAPNA